MISNWIDLFQRGEVEPDPIDSYPRSVSINGRLFSHTVPIPAVLQSLVQIQYESLRRTPNVYDEL